MTPRVIIVFKVEQLNFRNRMFKFHKNLALNLPTRPHFGIREYVKVDPESKEFFGSIIFLIDLIIHST